jgi:hypothetical protein
MTSYNNPNITVVLTDVKNSVKQVHIAKWLNYEMESFQLLWIMGDRN